MIPYLVTFNLRNRRSGEPFPSATVSRNSPQAPSGVTAPSSAHSSRSEELSTWNVTSVASGFTGQESTRYFPPASSRTASFVTLPQGWLGSMPVAYFIRLEIPSPAGQASGAICSSGVPSAKWSCFHLSYPAGAGAASWRSVNVLCSPPHTTVTTASRSVCSPFASTAISSTEVPEPETGETVTHGWSQETVQGRCVCTVSPVPEAAHPTVSSVFSRLKGFTYS
ncbi:hypothetical protein C1O40_05805 [Akkermansia muciniphila]|nr:hypothetical protein C1O40_05805 [Akkermansia muciniphila]